MCKRWVGEDCDESSVGSKSIFVTSQIFIFILYHKVVKFSIINIDKKLLQNDKIFDYLTY